MRAGINKLCETVEMIALFLSNTTLVNFWSWYEKDYFSFIFILVSNYPINKKNPELLLQTLVTLWPSAPPYRDAQQILFRKLTFSWWKPVKGKWGKYCFSHLRNISITFEAFDLLVKLIILLDHVYKAKNDQILLIYKKNNILFFMKWYPSIWTLK